MNFILLLVGLAFFFVVWLISIPVFFIANGLLRVDRWLSAFLDEVFERWF